MKATKIVATLGPASEDTIPELIQAGVNVFRLNASHGNHDYMLKLIKKIRETDKSIAIMLDTKGPEIRTREEKTFKKDEIIKLTNNEEEGFYIGYAHLDQLSKGNKILIDDGHAELEITNTLEARALEDAIIGAKKTVTIKGHNVQIPFLSKQDEQDIDFAIEHKLDFIAASFVRTKEEVEQLKDYIQEKQSTIRVIAKIEHEQAINNIDSIIKASQGIMVARGDLGVELPLEQVPKAQANIIKKCNELGRPVIVATQMLESMTQNPRPTRAEVGDVATAILQGADAIMLSGETAAGKHPLRAVQAMTTIAKAYEHEQAPDISDDYYCQTYYEKRATSLFVTRAAALAAKKLKTAAIITPTESGYTPRKVSRFKPQTKIIAVTSHEHVQRQLQLTWGVIPLIGQQTHEDLDDMIKNSIRLAYKEQLVTKEDKVVITAGHELSKSKLTNNLHIFTVKNCL